jgi:hypothetical protein
MATSIYIPGLLRLVVLKKPAEIVAANAAAGVDRLLTGRGGFFNRLIISKLEPFRTAGGQPWPAFCPRSDPIRAKRQDELEQRLSHVEPNLARISGEIAELAGFVRGGSTTRPVGLVVQQAVGRLFFDDYRATNDSYGAAVLLSDWLAAGPVKTLRLRLSGRLQPAIETITGQARGDLACAHATGLAFHNIVESMTLMRRLAGSGGTLGRLSPAEATARTLRGPGRVLREVQGAAVQALGIRLRERSLVILALEDARKNGAGADLFFFSGEWNRCPAHALVPAMLAEVWRAAGA